jgi:hypothetical protein
MDLQVTSLEQLKKIAQGDIIPLPSFTGDEPFIVRAKRPSLLALIKSGAIPNTLLKAAQELFYGKDVNSDVDMSQLTDVMTVIAEKALIEPSMEQLNELELQLTDEQLVAIFNYTQQGLKAVEKFRPITKDNDSDSNSETVQPEAQSGSGTE